MPYETILYDVDGPVLTITLNRPDKLNAYTAVMGAELADAFQRADQDDQVRVVIVTGAGRAFCAGADINLIHSIRTVEEGIAAAKTGREIFQLCQQLKVPVVAAIEGPCVGGGCELALFCDVRVASEHPATQIGLPETKQIGRAHV